jgi:hypothetical protein
MTPLIEALVAFCADEAGVSERRLDIIAHAGQSDGATTFVYRPGE